MVYNNKFYHIYLCFLLRMKEAKCQGRYIFNELNKEAILINLILNLHQKLQHNRRMCLFNF